VRRLRWRQKSRPAMPPVAARPRMPRRGSAPSEHEAPRGWIDVQTDSSGPKSAICFGGRGCSWSVGGGVDTGGGVNEPVGAVKSTDPESVGGGGGAGGSGGGGTSPKGFSPRNSPDMASAPPSST